MLIFPLHWLCCKIITGVPEQLAKNPVPFFGDQLTRVRLQGAKSLRIMAPTPEGRFADVGPIVCTLWHAKQDFLEVMCCLFVMVFLFLNFCLSWCIFYFWLGREMGQPASDSSDCNQCHGLTIITLVIHKFSIALFPTKRA